MTTPFTKPKRAGYTLIELIVAVGLFAVVMTLSTGAYLVMINANRQTQGLATGINNLAFVLESITTAMRTGGKFSCASTNTTPVDCPSGGTTVSYTNQKGCVVSYTLASGAIVESQVVSTGCPPFTNIVLTAPALAVTQLTFYVTGTANTDTSQPYVTITAAGTVTVGPGKTQPFSVESSVIMRGSDIL